VPKGKKQFLNHKIGITNEIIHNPIAEGKKQFEVVNKGDVVMLPAFGATVDEKDTAEYLWERLKKDREVKEHKNKEKVEAQFLAKHIGKFRDAYYDDIVELELLGVEHGLDLRPIAIPRKTGDDILRYVGRLFLKCTGKPYWQFTQRD